MMISNRPIISVNGFLQVKREDIVRVGSEQNVFARISGGPDEGLQIGPLRIDRSGSFKGGNLVGKEGRLGQRADLSRSSLRAGLIDNAHRLCPGQRIGANR